MNNARMIRNGNLTNIATYEFICHDKSDLPTSKYNFGSTALVIHDDDGKVRVYIADAELVWCKFA